MRSNGSITYAFNPRSGEEAQARQHLEAIVRDYQEHSAQSVPDDKITINGSDPLNVLERLVETFRRFDELYDGNFVTLSHEGNNLSVMLHTTMNDESKVVQLGADHLGDVRANVVDFS